jgi:hypothetical protein
MERQRKAIERKIRAITDAVENGLYAPSMNDRLRTLEAERETPQRRSEAAEAPSPVVAPETWPSSTGAGWRTSSSC